MRSLVWSVLAIAACKEAPPRTETPPAATQVPFDVVDPLAFLPADSDIVFEIDVAELRRSDLWKQYEHQLLAIAAPGFAGCPYDPLLEISTIMAGIPMADRAEGIFVIRGIDREKTLGCLRSSKEATDTTTAFDGDVVTLTNKSGSINVLTFVDARTMVSQGSHHPTKETLMAALQVGAPLRRDAAFAAAADKLFRGSALAMTMRSGSPELAARLRERLGVSAQAFSFNVHMAEHVEFFATVELATAAQAASFLDAIKPQLDARRQYVERLEAHAEGKNVKVIAAVTDTQLRSFIALIMASVSSGAAVAQ